MGLSDEARVETLGVTVVAENGGASSISSFSSGVKQPGEESMDTASEGVDRVRMGMGVGRVRGVAALDWAGSVLGGGAVVAGSGSVHNGWVHQCN